MPVKCLMSRRHNYSLIMDLCHSILVRDPPSRYFNKYTHLAPSLAFWQSISLSTRSTFRSAGLKEIMTTYSHAQGKSTRLRLESSTTTGQIQWSTTMHETPIRQKDNKYESADFWVLTTSIIWANANPNVTLSDSLAFNVGRIRLS